MPALEVSAQSILSEIRCAICLDVIEKATMIKKCSHRFCYNCILSTIQNIPEDKDTTRSCPLCKEKFTSRRDFQKDPFFDDLIASLYPKSKRVPAPSKADIDQYKKLYRDKVRELKALQKSKMSQTRSSEPTPRPGTDADAAPKANHAAPVVVMPPPPPPLLPPQAMDLGQICVILRVHPQV